MELGVRGALGLTVTELFDSKQISTDKYMKFRKELVTSGYQ